jgi:hypothetical protein
MGKLMNNQLKVKYSSLNDNSIAFDGHLFPKEQLAELAFCEGCFYFIVA